MKQLVTPKIAKYADESGFDWSLGWNDYYYDPSNDNKLEHGCDIYKPSFGVNMEDMSQITEEEIKYDKWFEQLIKAPTKSILQDWLWMIHKIFITVLMDTTTDKRVYFYTSIKNDDEIQLVDGLTMFDNPYDALDEGLEIGLDCVNGIYKLKK